ncbi:hypothetical protein DPMN_173366 [Dreissena polymorpha]|uniref:Uncharacterized protein n=1 Tax=Dreissena polymorpha TaxID=45954 RepID=A0A9D4E4Y8_DREPO|nr:hypothetical protein DPMN_173366 [Dreissena polymorpha]
MFQLHNMPLKELFCEENPLLQHIPVHSVQEEEVLSLKVSCIPVHSVREEVLSLKVSCALSTGGGGTLSKGKMHVHSVQEEEVLSLKVSCCCALSTGGGGTLSKGKLYPCALSTVGRTLSKGKLL